MTPEQCIAGRKLLGWNTPELGRRAGLNFRAIARWERGEHPYIEPMNSKLRSALETAGVEFGPENGSGPGVQLRKPLILVEP